MLEKIKRFFTREVDNEEDVTEAVGVEVVIEPFMKKKNDMVHTDVDEASNDHELGSVLPKHKRDVLVFGCRYVVEELGIDTTKKHFKYHEDVKEKIVNNSFGFHINYLVCNKDEFSDKDEFYFEIYDFLFTDKRLEKEVSTIIEKEITKKILSMEGKDKKNRVKAHLGSKMTLTVQIDEEIEGRRWKNRI